MKKLAALSIIGSCIASTAVGRLSSPFSESGSFKPAQRQIPVAMSESANANMAGSSGKLILSDVLGRENSISIFVGLIRDVESVSKRLDDRSSNATILAPLNTELMKMSRKPWEDPEDYNALGANAYEGPDGESRAQKNLRKFVESHIVPQSPWPVDSKVSTLAGTSVTLKDNDGNRSIDPDHIEVVDVADKVSNGQVWIINGVLRRAS